MSFWILIALAGLALAAARGLAVLERRTGSSDSPGPGPLTERAADQNRALRAELHRARLARQRVTGSPPTAVAPETLRAARAAAAATSRAEADHETARERLALPPDPDLEHQALEQELKAVARNALPSSSDARALH